MVAKKHKSKRVSAGLRYKIEKKVRDSHKKSAREAKRNPKPKAKKKDPGIPNSFPMKEQLLQDIEERKMRNEEEKLRQKADRAALVSKNRQGLEGLVADASQRTQEFEENQSESDGEGAFAGGEVVDGTVSGTRDNSKKAYYKEFRKVVENADVILYVLDARDPMGCRAEKIERLIMETAGKRIVFVLNKIDLVPRDIVQKWLKYLRNEFPTVAFKASTQQQRSNLGQSKLNVTLASEKSIRSTNESIGADDLIKLLKNYCRNANIKTSITVGVIGYPNVGKSSVINSLKRSKVCGVGSTPGLTKSTQVISLDKTIKLLDCPGIVFSQERGAKSAEAVLRNCIKVELLEDPIAPVEVILQKIQMSQLCKIYSVPAYRDVQDFLVSLARLKGRIKKGGRVDIESTARIVIQDWNSGKISYYSPPPSVPKSQTKSTSVIVQQWSEEFKLDDLKSSEEILLQQSQEENNDELAIESMQVDVDMDAKLDSESDSEDGMEESDECPEAVDFDNEADEQDSMDMSENLPMNPVKSQPRIKQQKPVDVEEMELNPQHGKDIKKMLKKMKKLKSRESKTVREDSYDFTEDFDLS